MRIVMALLVVVLLLACGCSTENHRMNNPAHVWRHVTQICDDFHAFHVDIDRVILGIWEVDEDYRLKLD